LAYCVWGCTIHLRMGIDHVAAQNQGITKPNAGDRNTMPGGNLMNWKIISEIQMPEYNW
jgi:hypothetical protein